MKFCTAVLLSAFGLTGAKKLINKQALLRNAVPVDKNGNRRLADQRFEISGEYTLQFHHCVSLKVSSEEYEDILFNENMVAATYAGKVLAQTSYVLFNVCVTEKDCFYEAENYYMVDLPTYMGAIVDGEQQKKENYCEACEQSYDTCFPAQEEEAGAEGEGAEGEGAGGEGAEGEGAEGEGAEGGNEGGRRLADVKYYNGQGYIVADCDTCMAKGCFDEDVQVDDANWQVTDQGIQEWVEEMLNCADTEVAGGVGNLYAGFICNSKGNGVEPAIFLDNACAVYTSLYSYGNIVQGTNDEQLMYAAADLVTGGFLYDTSCEQFEYVSIEEEYNLQYQVNQQQNNNANNGNQEERAAEASEVCRQISENAIDLDTCGGYEAEENDEQEDVEQEEDQDYSWYTYLVAADAANDIQGSCVVVAALQGEFSIAHTYKENDGDGAGSGHVYDYKSSKAFGANMTAGKIFGVVIAVIVVIVAAVLIMQSMGSKKDAKKVPLVSNKDGALA